MVGCKYTHLCVEACWGCMCSLCSQAHCSQALSTESSTTSNKAEANTTAWGWHDEYLKPSGRETLMLFLYNVQHALTQQRLAGTARVQPMSVLHVDA